MTATIIVQRAFWGNFNANALIHAVRPAGLESQALTAVIPSFTAFRDFGASAIVTTPSVTGITDALTATVMIVRAFNWNENASIEGNAKTVSGKVGQALSATVISGAANWDLNAFLSGRTKTEARVAELVAFELIITEFVSFHAIATLMTQKALV